MKQLKLALLIASLVLTQACADKKSRPTQKPTAPSAGPAAPASTPTAPGGSPQTPAPQGSSSGGGGFVGENSTVILKMAASSLAKYIRASSPELYKNLPAGWSQEKLAKTIAEVRYEPLTERAREGDQLMFDYGTDNKGPFIVALKPFFHAYSSFPIKFTERVALGTLMNDLHVKLAHEVSHLMGLDENLAKVFSRRLMQTLYRDTVLCDFENANDWFEQVQSKIPGAAIYKGTFIINRPSGNSTYLLYQQLPIENIFYFHSRPTMSPAEFGPVKDSIINHQRSCVGSTRLGRADFHAYFSHPQISETNGEPSCHDFAYEHRYQIVAFPGEARPLETGFMLQNKKTYSGRTETLSIEDLNSGSPKGSVAIVHAKSGKTKSIGLTCRRIYDVMEFPKTGDTLKQDADSPEKPTLAIPPQDAPRSPEVPEMDQVTETLLKQRLAGKFLEFLGGAWPFDGSASCAGPSYSAYIGNATFKLQDGRTCTIGLGIAYQRDSQGKLQLLFADKAEIITQDHRRNLGDLACFKDNKKVDSEDVAKDLKWDSIRFPLDGVQDRPCNRIR